MASGIGDPVGPGAPIGIGFPSPASDSYRLEAVPDSHHMVWKSSGSDPGVYATPCPEMGTPPPPKRYYIEQGGTMWEVVPMVDDVSVEEFYSYNDPIAASSDTDLEISNTSLLFLYMDSTTGELSLVAIHDQPDDGTGGQVSYHITGLPAAADFVVQDDPNPPDSYVRIDDATAQVDWVWSPCCTDGMALSGGLSDGEWHIEINPNFIDGIDRWAYLSGSLEAPEALTLDMAQPISIWCESEEPPPPPKRYYIEQGDMMWEVVPMVGSQSVEDFYSYGNPFPASAATGLEKEDASILFLYMDSTTGELSLVAIHDRPADDEGGLATFDIIGLPPGTGFAVQDDAINDTYTGPDGAGNARAEWGWGACCTDGMALNGGFDQEWHVTINAEFVNIAAWEFLTGNLGAPEGISLDMVQPVTIWCSSDVPEPSIQVRWIPTEDPGHDLGHEPLLLGIGETRTIDLVIDGLGAEDYVYAGEFHFDVQGLAGMQGAESAVMRFRDAQPDLPDFNPFGVQGPGLALDGLEGLRTTVVGFPDHGMDLRTCLFDPVPLAGDDGIYTFIKGVTDGTGVELQLLSQFDRAEWGETWCGPTAAGTSLGWFAEVDPAFGDLVPDIDGDGQITDVDKYEAVNTLGGFMETSPTDGTTDDYLVGDADTPGLGGAFVIKVFNHPSFGDYMRELQDGEDVLVGVSYP